MNRPAALGHRHLHVHGTSPMHGVAPEAKLAGLVAFVVIVALTPRRFVAAFTVDAIVVLTVIAIAALPVRLILRRLATITPFLAVALLLPFIGDGDEIDVVGLGLSVDGLWAAWNIVAKAVLGATASIVVTATTPIPDLLAGLSRLRIPAVVVGIIAFMLRYLDLIVDELGRMRRAMVARAHDPHWLWQARPIAGAAGTLFVRSYERGERVHAAMAARGYTGTMPELTGRRTPVREWTLALAPGAVAAAGVFAVALT